MTTPATRDEARAAYPALALHIAGEWVAGQSGATIPVLDPATEEQLGHAPVAAQADVDRAAAAAHAAFPAWRDLPPADRGAVLSRAADLLAARREEIAGVIALELGKPVAQARVEVDTAVGHVRWSAEEGRRTYGRVIPSGAGQDRFVFREPLGPVAAFAPWNAPIITPARKIAYALAAGCTVVIKPAEETPGTAICLVQALVEAGLPAGAVNLVLGDPARVSHQLLTDPRIRAVTFTGSVEVGRSLAELAGRQLKVAVMELGGHAPVVVCSDVPVAAFADGAAQAAYRNSGQICTSPTRFLVERASYDGFVAAFTRRVADLRVGDPFDPKTEVGPLATARRLGALQDLVDDAVRCGARLMTGGMRVDRPGYFWNPALLADVGPASQISTVEPFGPIATVQPFDSIEDALSIANGVPVGLSSYVFTDRAATQRRLVAGLDYGSIAVNQWQASTAETPFGGHRDSGFGSEGGSEGIAAFQQTKYVGLR